MAAALRFVAADVREGVVTNVGRWLMEEQPAETIALIRISWARNGWALRPVLPAPLAGKLPRACLAGEASIIPAGQSLIAGYGQRMLSTSARSRIPLEIPADLWA
jgi:hypothetical protein